jgi:hypothetical protein
MLDRVGPADSLPGLITVNERFGGQPQHPLGEDGLEDLRGAALDGVGDRT